MGTGYTGYGARTTQPLQTKTTFQPRKNSGRIKPATTKPSQK